MKTQVEVKVTEFDTVEVRWVDEEWHIYRSSYMQGEVERFLSEVEGADGAKVNRFFHN